MRPDELAYLRCPRCRGALLADAAAVRCPACASVFPVEGGVPRFLIDPSERVRRHIAALDADMRRHHWVVAKMSLAAFMWLPAERVRLLRALDIRPGQTVLDHCTGPGSNLPALAAALGPTGHLVGMDLSGLVLEQAAAMLRQKGIAADLHQADALALPYADATFDAVVHYGALNQFGPDTRTAIDEIFRVTRPGGLVVLLDEGIVERRRDTWWGRLLIWGNPLFGFRPPLELLPAGTTPAVRWVMRGMFYEVQLRKPGAT